MTAADPLQRALDRAVETGAVAGVAAILLDADGPAHRGAAGERSRGSGAPMATDSVMLLASMTKLLTVLSAMTFVEEGRLDLDAPAGTYVPEIDALPVLAGWDGATPILRAPVRRVTTRHLATHTAGMPYGLWDADRARYDAAIGIPSVRTGDPKALTGALTRDPGEAWDYGTSIDWLAQVVARIGGASIGTVIRERLTGPLGMDDTGHRITPAMRDRLARIHVRDADGDLRATDSVRRQDPVVEEGGGGMYGTAEDYARLLRMLLDGGVHSGGRILSEATVRATFAGATGGLRVRRMATTNSAAAADLDFGHAAAPSIALAGIRLEAEAATGRGIGSVGWAGIANTFWWIDPARGRAGVWMAQVAPFLDPATHAASLDWERAALARSAA